MTATETIRPVTSPEAPQEKKPKVPKKPKDNRVALCRTRGQRIGLIVGFALILAIPLSVGNDFLISLGVTVGIYAIAAAGLNVLSGYAGQISLAQSVFVGIGGFAGVGLGTLVELPLILWLPATFIIGGLVAALIAPLTLRLRGVFQIILSLGLIFVSQYAFANMTFLTGGNGGISAAPSLSLGFIDFGALTVGGMQYSYQQGLFILVWLCLAACMIAVVNMNRTRTGRAMVAIREAEIPAQIAGINVNAVKMKAFIIAGAFGGLAGGLLLTQVRYLQFEQFEITLALELLVMVVVGGLGTTWGPVIGATIIASIPVLATQYGSYIPFLQEDFSQSAGFGIPVGQFGTLIYGLALVLVMVFEPRGIAHWVSRGAAKLRSYAGGKRPPT